MILPRSQLARSVSLNAFRDSSDPALSEDPAGVALGGLAVVAEPEADFNTDYVGL